MLAKPYLSKKEKSLVPWTSNLDTFEEGRSPGMSRSVKSIREGRELPKKRAHLASWFRSLTNAPGDAVATKAATAKKKRAYLSSWFKGLASHDKKAAFAKHPVL